jgi:hypothetical protein
MVLCDMLIYEITSHMVNAYPSFRIANLGFYEMSRSLINKNTRMIPSK